MKAYALTDVGRVRQMNQDSYYLPRAGERFAVVADGMGGHKAGEVASSLAVREFIRWLACAPKPDEATMRYAVAEANSRIYLEAKAHPEHAGMGTTLTALWMDSDSALLAHVGDSRAYLFREGTLTQVTQDHSLVGELLAEGRITPEAARVHPHRHYITRAIGTSPQVDADIMRVECVDGDVWLLCSDGLINHVTDAELCAILKLDITWPRKLDEMVALALKRGGSDNITALLALCEGVAL